MHRILAWFGLQTRTSALQREQTLQAEHITQVNSLHSIVRATQRRVDAAEEQLAETRRDLATTRESLHAATTTNDVLSRKIASLEEKNVTLSDKLHESGLQTQRDRSDHAAIVARLQTDIRGHVRVISVLMDEITAHREAVPTE